MNEPDTGNKSAGDGSLLASIFRAVARLFSRSASGGAALEGSAATNTGIASMGTNQLAEPPSGSATLLPVGNAGGVVNGGANGRTGPASNVNRQAFLTMIALCEGTQRGSDPGYDVIVTGADGKRETFTDFSEHPFAAGRKAKLIRPGLYSTASGRYQQLLANWVVYRRTLSLPDFGPDSQDRIAVQQIKEAGALALVDGGNLTGAVSRCAHLWASLPGAGYGQPEHALDTARAYYIAAGGQEVSA